MIMEKDTRINRVYNILRGKMKGYGRNVSLPINTDPKKTYSWRYLSNFVDRLDKESIPDEYIPDVIDAILRHAKRNKLLGRGFAVLNKIDIMPLVVNKLHNDEKVKKIKEENILQTSRFLLEKRQNTSKSLLELLTERRHCDAYTNMTCWYDQGLLKVEYIALSRACRKAMIQMKPNERTIFPGTLELMKLRLLLLSDKELARIAQNELKNDLMVD